MKGSNAKQWRNNGHFPINYSGSAAAAAAAAAKSIQSCQTLCDPIDGSPPGFAIPGILQARVLEWGAIAFSDSGSRYCKRKYASYYVQKSVSIS